MQGVYVNKYSSLFRVKVLLLAVVLFIPQMAASSPKLPAHSAASFPVWAPIVGVAVVALFAVVVIGLQYTIHRRQEENREKRQRAYEQEAEYGEMRSLLCSARHELAFFYMNYKDGAGEVLGQVEGGAYLEHVVPVEHERYYIYPICASNIGKIRDAILGRQILYAYTKQIRFIETMKWNNNLLRWLLEARKRHMEFRDEESVNMTASLEESLREHVPKMKLAFNEMETATKTIMEYINEDGTVSPKSMHKLHSRYHFLNSPQSVRYR